MDNASKALIIAGGFFISLLLISMFTVALTSYRQYHVEMEEQRVAKEVQEFNSRFPDVYKGAILKPYQIYNIIGMAIEVNSSTDREYEITINDGSTNYVTVSQLKELRKKFYFTENLAETNSAGKTVRYEIQSVSYSNGAITGVKYKLKVG